MEQKKHKEKNILLWWKKNLFMIESNFRPSLSVMFATNNMLFKSLLLLREVKMAVDVYYSSISHSDAVSSSKNIFYFPVDKLRKN